MKVLVTDGEQRAALAVVRSLGRHNLNVIVTSENKKNISGYSRYCNRNYQCHSSVTDEPKFIRDIQHIINRESIDFIFPISDISMYSILNLANQIPRHLTSLFPDYHSFSFLSDKYKLLKLCQNININIPNTFFLKDYSQIESIKDKLEYPLIIKPARSYLKVKEKWIKGQVNRIYHFDELIKICEQNLIYQHPFLLQEIVEGEIYGIFCLIKNGQVITKFGHKRLREFPPSGGVSVLRESVVVNENLFNATKKIIDYVKWNGPLMAEFKFDEQTQQYHLIEINGRFWGSLQLAIDSGIDFPWLLIKSNNKISKNGYLKGEKLRWILGDLDHHIALLKTEKNLLKKIKHIWKFFSYRDSNLKTEIFRIHDLNPFLLELYVYLKSFFLYFLKKVPITKSYHMDKIK